MNDNLQKNPNPRSPLGLPAMNAVNLVLHRSIRPPNHPRNRPAKTSQRRKNPNFNSKVRASILFFNLVMFYNKFNVM